ncbi:Phosphatidylinositide phosphatase SAC1 [Chytridiales sp. JEL 0842]|nr:Phosphatidylinositide phosphatase SAC1 [Chytridiales sp. JEL 0842]
MIYESLSLYISDETITLEPVYSDPTVPRQTLIIARSTGDIRMNAPPAPTLRQEEVLLVYGVLGIISLNSGNHLIVISNRAKIGKLYGKDIYTITGHQIIPVSKSRIHLSDSQADERFFWNKYLQRSLIAMAQKDPDNMVSRFILPVMYGFISIRSATIKDRPVTLALISRRSKFRAGTRFNTRGIDQDGAVANFVETEQILVATDSGSVASYVQSRGSIPLFWQQQINVKYQPELILERNIQTSDMFKRHLLEQISFYGDQILINLINKSGYESKLGDEFVRQCRLLNDSRVLYIHFDFHHECRKMRWDRLSLLVQQIEQDLSKQGYCLVDDKFAVVREQTSIIRTNCMDCLDRTNVVQSVFAKKSLLGQLRLLGYLAEQEEIYADWQIEKVFKNMWADNADEISRQYSGTGALKTDYTRTGKRSMEGVLNDFSNSVIRYAKNNFLDGSRQVCW